MASEDATNYGVNTFIFNWVRNYNDQIIALKECMESLQNNVQIYNHLTSEQLAKVVDKLSKANFELYNYIVVIILDNECEFQQFVKTSDNQHILLYSEILTQIQRNSTLNGIKRLFVIQKLLDARDLDDENVDEVDKMIKKRKCKIKQTGALYPGLTISIRADEYTKNFVDSLFVETFSRHFRNKAKTVPMDVILKRIMKEIKSKRCYKINIEIGSNGNTTSNLIYGNGVCCDVLRDFF